MTLHADTGVATTNGDTLCGVDAYIENLGNKHVVSARLLPDRFAHDKFVDAVYGSTHTHTKESEVGTKIQS